MEAPLNCRVCGLAQSSPPWGDDGASPLFEFCACCGVEFGYQDATPHGARRFRARWLADGSRWSEPQERPARWNAAEQLLQVPERFR